MKLYLCVFLAIFFSNKVFSQYKIKDSCAPFTLNIEAENLPSDSIRLLYTDCSYIPGFKNTFFVTNGKATISGVINRATEGILFTDVKSLWMDGPKVIRFIIEPGIMTLHFKIVNDTVRNVGIEGSRSEKQKVAWQEDNASLLQTRESYRDTLIQLYHQKDKNNDSTLDKKIQVMDYKFGALQEVLMKQILKYARTNPHSYVSGYLLNHYKRSIPTDTLQTFFCYLDSTVIHSDFGKNILDELFKLTDDWAFRKKFTDSVFYKKLKNIKSIYDVSLTNTKGTKTSLSEFKGNIILIDFWANWCGPCIRNAPYLKKMMNEMKGKPFKVISVSIDDNIDIWKKSIKKYGFPGVHLFDGSGLLSNYYKVLWVPRYIIINPDGTVANMNAPQAIDPQLKVELDNLIEKDKLK